MKTDYEEFSGLIYQLSIINEAKEKLRNALKMRDVIQAKQYGLGIPKDPLDSEAYEIARTDAQARINVYSMALVDMMDVYTRSWK